MEILSSAQMSAADAYTINELGIPSAVLMENAASSFVSHLLEKYPDISSAAVAAGAGNNGGDGLAIARLLDNAGIHTDIYLACPAEKLKGDALINFNILTKYPVNIFTVEEDDIPVFDNYDITIDALFGTGLTRPLTGFYEELVNSINLTSALIASVDIPSGLSGDTWEIIGTCVDADLTVTFGRPKYPHIMFPARKMCGEVAVADISIPDFAVDTVGCDTFLLTPDSLPLMTEREPDSHKGHFGHAVIIGGSEGKSGAAFMASMSCARTGAGLTTLAVPGGLISAAESVNPEIMSIAVGKGAYFDMSDTDRILKFLKGKTVASIGMGLGTDEQTGMFVNYLIKNTDIPFVIDADGINLLSKDILPFLKGRGIITPHIGEFARMMETDTSDVMKNRLELARCMAVQYGIIVVLKSADTVIALPNGRIFVDISGTPALSKGGSGDCLTGIITGFISQGFDMDFACLLGCYTLGRTAEIVSSDMNERSVMTTDIINNIHKTLDELEENS